MLEWKVQGDGILLAVKARPGGKENRLRGIHAGMLKVEVTAPPEKGEANDAISRLLACELDLAPSKVQIIRGQTSSKKLILIQGVDPKALTQRFQSKGIDMMEKEKA
ncbi:DUF167 domain-containing protein [bacterium]|jgi:uncharacterized protein|nr:DUF167 domain-containing protein [bacterium]